MIIFKDENEDGVVGGGRGIYMFSFLCNGKQYERFLIEEC